MASAFALPDVLVLAAGGVVGEAWMNGVLAGIEDAAGIDFRRVETFVGTSAGALVAARLAAGLAPRRPWERAADEPASRRGPGEAAPSRIGPGEAGPSRSALGAAGRAAAQCARGISAPLGAAGRTAAHAAWGVSAPLATTALAVGAPVGALARALLLARVPVARGSLEDVRRGAERHGVRFDGRLRVVAVDRASGRRVVFGAPGGPPATVGAAVAASCAVPTVFAPVRIDGREYVDGGVWSLTNLDVAPAGRDTEVLCLSVTHSLRLALHDPLSALRAATAVVTAAETHALTRRGARVRTIGPDAGSAAAAGGGLMDRQRAAGALAAGYRQGLRVGGGPA